MFFVFGFDHRGRESHQLVEQRDHLHHRFERLARNGQFVRDQLIIFDEMFQVLFELVGFVVGQSLLDRGQMEHRVSVEEAPDRVADQVDAVLDGRAGMRAPADDRLDHRECVDSIGLDQRRQFGAELRVQ